MSINPAETGGASEPRVLIFSQRNLNSLMYQCFMYEFEDVVRSVDSVELLAPQTAYPSEIRLLAHRARNVARKAAGMLPLGDIEVIRIDRDYELFFAVFQFPDQTIYLNRLNGWRRRCRKAACYLAESWTTMLSTSRAYYEILSSMDSIFTHSEVSARALTQLLGRPCYFLPFAVDALQFCPAPAFRERSIDVLAVGRHSPRVHKELVRLSQEDGLFYHYDTAQPFRVRSYVEHRRMLAELCKRARFTLTYKHNVDMNALTGGDESLAPRFFEAAAAGSVLLGIPPDCEDFRNCFNWDDAVIDFPFDGGDVRGILAELSRQPERLAAARTNNMAHSLKRHDWAHRWMSVLAQAGLPSTPAMQQRLSTMNDLAHGFQQTLQVDPGDNKHNYAIPTHHHNSRPNLGVAKVS